MMGEYMPPQTVFHEGCVQHWVKEPGNDDSKLTFQGELMEVEQ